jgi:hypothetical protein
MHVRGERERERKELACMTGWWPVWNLQDRLALASWKPWERLIVLLKAKVSLQQAEFSLTWYLSPFLIRPSFD